MTPTIALLTDFGIQDVYVGVMKGVMCRIVPSATMIDITHHISPQNVHEAGLALLNSVQYFPNGTVFLIVVDPGVGTQRRPIAICAGEYIFVAPDNGVLTAILTRFESYQAYELTEARYWLDATSQTFHGRDIFAPVAAHLASGVPCEQIGRPLESIVLLPPPRLEISPTRVIGEVTHIDHFGNIITSIGAFEWHTSDRLTLKSVFDDDQMSREIPSEQVRITIGATTIQRIHRAYGDAEHGQLIVLIGSNGYLEVAINQGHAGRHLGVGLGEQVVIDIQT